MRWLPSCGYIRERLWSVWGPVCGKRDSSCSDDSYDSVTRTTRCGERVEGESVGRADG